MEDYKGALLALIRIQEAYLIDSRTIQQGLLSQKYPSRKLTGFILLNKIKMKYCKRYRGVDVFCNENFNDLIFLK